MEILDFDVLALEFEFRIGGLESGGMRIVMWELFREKNNEEQLWGVLNV